MFKECLIDIDFNLLVLNITSLFELSLLPGPASLSAVEWAGPRCWASLPAFLRVLLHQGWSQLLVCAVTQPCDRDSHSAGSSRSSWPQAPSQVTSPDPSLGDGALRAAQVSWGSVLSRSHVNAQHGPWARAKPSSSGCPGAPPAQERLCLRGWWQHTPAPVPSPSSLFPHVAHSDTWDVS